MALLFADRVRVTTTAAPGTGTFAISTAVAAYQGFPSSFVVGTQCYYLIEDGTAWETGIGTLTASGVWTRTTVLASSNSNAAISASISAVLSLTPSAQFAIDLQSRSDSNLGRNRIRNSRFLVNQRGTSFSVSAAYQSDGWIGSASAGTYTASVAAPSATYGYSGSMTVSAASLTAAGTLVLSQRIESYDVMDLVGGYVTLSFWLLATTSAGTLSFAINLNTPTAQDNYASTTTQQTVTVTPTGTATRYTVVFPNVLPAAAANGLAVAFQLTQNASTGNASFTLAGVQLEAGQYATALARIPLYMEVEWCQRFYNAQSGGESFYDTAGGAFYQQYFYPTRMRAAATVAFTGTSVTNLASAAYTSGTVDGFYATTKATAAGLATYTYSYTASAEL